MGWGLHGDHRAAQPHPLHGPVSFPPIGADLKCTPREHLACSSPSKPISQETQTLLLPFSPPAVSEKRPLTTLHPGSPTLGTNRTSQWETPKKDLVGRKVRIYPPCLLASGKPPAVTASLQGPGSYREAPAPSCHLSPCPSCPPGGSYFFLLLFSVLPHYHTIPFGFWLFQHFVSYFLY